MSRHVRAKFGFLTHWHGCKFWERAVPPPHSNYTAGGGHMTAILHCSKVINVSHFICQCILWTCIDWAKRQQAHHLKPLYSHIASVLAVTLLVLTWLLPLQVTVLFSIEMVMLTLLNDTWDGVQQSSPQTDHIHSCWTEQLTVMLQDSPDRLVGIAKILRSGVGTASATFTGAHQLRVTEGD